MASSKHYRITNPLDVRDLADQIAAWTAAGNPKANDWQEQPAAPSADAVWTADAEWVVPPAPLYSPEDWTAKHFTSAQIIALQRFEFALQAAGKPLGPQMQALKTWLETMLLASVDSTPRTFVEPPCSYGEAAGEAVGALAQ